MKAWFNGGEGERKKKVIITQSLLSTSLSIAQSLPFFPLSHSSSTIPVSAQHPKVDFVQLAELQVGEFGQQTHSEVAVVIL